MGLNMRRPPLYDVQITEDRSAPTEFSHSLWVAPHDGIRILKNKGEIDGQ